MSKEIWKDISGYEGMYQVSNFGNVKSLTREIMNRGVKQQIKERLLRQNNKGGYLFVVLSKEGKTKSFAVHRLVAEEFIQNPENKPQVSHLDENPLNNNVLNLAWATAEENCNYGKRNERVFKAGVVKPSKVSMYSKDGHFIKRFDSLCEAGRYIGKGKHHSAISACARGKRKTAYGFIWKYIN